MCPEDRDLLNYRDHAYEIERAAELLYNEAKNSLDFAVAKRTEEQAKSSYKMAVAAHRLNVLAAIFFPIVTISSVLGMNLGRGLEEEMFSQWVFWLVLLAGVACGFVLKAAIIESPHRPDKIDPNKRV